MEWREEIIKGISVLPKLGDPGRIVVYGKHAEPILTGRNEEDVLVAAAEFGKGRIVAISHDGYAFKFLDTDSSTEDVMTKFHTNLKQWLTRGTYEKGNRITSADESVSEERLMSSKIVIFKGGLSTMPPKDLTEYVRHGGALIYCLNLCGWLQLNDGKTISDIPYANLLNEAGICYTEESISAADDGFYIDDKEAKDGHLHRVMEYVGSDFEKAVEKVNMLKGLKYLPTEQMLQRNIFVRKIFKSCREDLETCRSPTPRTPDTIKRERAVLDLWLMCYDILRIRTIKASRICFFPGDFSDEPPFKCYTLEFPSDICYIHPTACYLPAGKTLKLEVISGNEDKNWKLMVGCHKDVPQSDGLFRWPVVTKKVSITQKSIELSTPFGGLIYLIGPDKPSFGIKVKLENVVDAPRFRLTEGEKGREIWEHSRHSPGLWADIEGELVTITMPASSVIELDFDALTSVMKIWDSVVRLYHDLRGTDVYKSQRIWIVADVQPRGSDMYSRHPNIIDLDVRHLTENDLLFSGGLQKIDNWDAFNEIGHTMLREEWTFESTGEVTVNIFTLCAMETICHLKAWIHEWLQGRLNDTEKFLKDGADFEKWKRSPGIALFIYAQLVHEFGWGSYRKVFRRYLAMNDTERPKDDQTKIDMWFFIFSEVVGFNLSPLALFWGIPLSDEVMTRLQIAFPVGFLPDDEVARFAPDRVDSVLRKFPEIVRRRL